MTPELNRTNEAPWYLRRRAHGIAFAIVGWISLGMGSRWIPAIAILLLVRLVMKLDLRWERFS
jgi:hypothetical protein